jgi:cell division topological specificity factor
MGLLNFWIGKKAEPSSASAAKERLQIIVARERSGAGGPDWLPELQREIIAIVAKYVNASADDIKVSVDDKDGMDVIDVSVQFPQAG